MKHFLFLLAAAAFTRAAGAQDVHQISADSVLFTSDSAHTELILENHTKDVTNGALFNKGNGRTEFRKILEKKNDTLYLVGGDSLKIKTVTGSYVRNDTAEQTASFNITGTGRLRTLTLTPQDTVAGASGTSGTLRFNKASRKAQIYAGGLWRNLLVEGGTKVPDYIYNGNGTAQNASFNINGTGLIGTSLKVGTGATGGILSINPAATARDQGIISFGTDTSALAGHMIYADLGRAYQGSYGILKAEGTSNWLRDTLVNLSVGVSQKEHPAIGNYVKIYRSNTWSPTGAGSFDGVKTTGYSADVNSYFSVAQAYYANALASAQTTGKAYAFYSDSGLVRIGRLATTLAAPATTGATKYVTTDEQGNLSFSSLNIPVHEETDVPTSTTAGTYPGKAGDMFLARIGDEDYLYIKTSTVWKRVELSPLASQ